MNNTDGFDLNDFIKSRGIQPQKFNFVFDVVDHMAAQEPGALAMIHIDPKGERREYEFGWFSKASARLANSLEARGIGRGDRVMLILYRRIDFWVSMLAMHRIGAVPIPSPSMLTTHDIIYRVNQAKVKVVIAEDSIVERVEKALPECPTLQLCIQAGDSEPLPGWEDLESIAAEGEDTFPRRPDSPGGEDPLLIFFSSGTTGPPKMVEHRHVYPLGHIVTAFLWHHLRPGDLHLTLADTGWGKAVWGKFYGQWMAGATVLTWDFRSKFDPAALLRLLVEHEVTGFCAPPTVYRFLVREDLSKYPLTKLRQCTTAGELLNESVFHAWKEGVGLPIYEGYGQTETTILLVTLPHNKPKPGSIGLPAPGWDVVLLDEDSQPSPPGEVGEICVRLSEDPANMPGLFSTYLDDSEKTAEVRYAGYYHTGDKAWVDEDGYFWFFGRVDDLIKSSGYRIGPFEVESALITHDAVIEAAVTGLPDPVRGQIVKATVVLSPGYKGSEALTKELQEHVKKLTAPYKYPRIIEYVHELPKTISGKIRRAEIRERDASK